MACEGKWEQIIWDAIEKYCKEHRQIPIWECPVVKFADARDEKFLNLKDLVVYNHYLPTDYLDNAVSVLSYFLPFKREIPRSNKDGELCSALWADSYLVTNDMFKAINEVLVQAVRDMG